MAEITDRHGSVNSYRIIFYYEKLLFAKLCYNAEHDIVYSATYQDIPENHLSLKAFTRILLWFLFQCQIMKYFL